MLALAVIRDILARKTPSLAIGRYVINQMVTRTLHIAALFGALFITWLVLSGQDDLVFMIYGAIACFLSCVLALRMQVVDNEGHPFHLAFTAPLYWLWLLKEMLISGLAVTRIVWLRRPTQPSFAWVSLSQRNDLGRTIYANSVTLTPGTVCVNVEQKRIFIHALDRPSIADLEMGEMDRRVTALATRFPAIENKEGQV